jgi:putative transposase
LKHRLVESSRLASIEEGRAFCRKSFAWYDHEHRQSGIGLMTPAAVHYGRAEEINEGRARVLDAAHALTPERFVLRPPRPPELPKAAWINKPDSEPDAEEVAH